MPYFVDIGGTPANESCAQLGQTPNFDVLNKLEVLAYKYAIIARYGAPPPRSSRRAWAPGSKPDSEPPSSMTTLPRA